MKSIYELPFINVRDVVVYPGLEISLWIGRDITIDALKKSRTSHRGNVIVITQKSVENAKPKNKRDMYSTGVLAKIIKSISFPDGTMRVRIHGIAPLRIREIYKRDEVRFAKGQVLKSVMINPLKLEEKESVLEEVIRWKPEIAFHEEFNQFKSLLKEKNPAKFVSQILSLTASPRKFFPSKKSALSLAKRTPNKLSKYDLENINLHIAHRQKVLNEPSPKIQLSMIRKILREETRRNLNIR